MNKHLIIRVGFASIMIGLMMPALVNLFAITYWPLSLMGNFVVQTMILSGILAGLTILFFIIAIFSSHTLKVKSIIFPIPPVLLIAIMALNFLAFSKAPSPLATPSSSQLANLQTPRLRIVHANLLGKPDALDKFIQWATIKNPDIIALTELPNGAPESETLTQLFKTYPWRTFSVVGGPARTMIISRHEIINKLPSIDHAATAHINTPQTGPLNIVSIHPPPPLSPLFAFRRNRILENSFQGATQNQHTKTTQPTLILGDFNAVPWAYPLRTLSTKHGFRRAYISNFNNTWMTPLPVLGLPIDHIYGTHHFAMVQYQIGPFIGSDHYPILADLIITQPPLTN